MAGLSQLSRLCSFTQVIPGCDISVPASPVPVFFNIVVDAAGNPIPPNSSAYSAAGTGFTGDGSGFVRSFFTGLDLLPVTNVVFLPNCGGGGSSASGVIRTIGLLGGKLIVRFADRDENANPVATNLSGVVSIAWTEFQTPISAIFAGNGDDLVSNEIIFENVGGKDINNHSQTDANGFWPQLSYQNRTRIVGDEPYEQTGLYPDGSISIFDMPITTPGTTRVKVTGISGSFGFKLQY